MNMEGFPTEPEKKEKEPITDEQCMEAMKTENFELVREWYAEHEKIADQDPTGKGRTNLTIKLGKMQFEAGLVDYARETLEAAYNDALQSGAVDLMLEIAPELDKIYQGQANG
jgi:hypothetical protein